MRRTLPYLLAAAVILGLSAYLLAEGYRLFGLGLGLLLLLLLGLVALDGSPRPVRTPAAPERPAPSALPAAELAALRAQVAAIAGLLQNPAPAALAAGDDASLRHAVETLARELSVREKESARHLELLVQRDQKRLLARIASIRETAEFMRRATLAGKMDIPQALDQMMLEIEAAVADVGLEVHQIAPGTRVADLPAAAFTALSAEPPPSPDQAGTVKEALSDALYLQDADGRRAYVSPAKLKLYRI